MSEWSLLLRDVDDKMDVPIQKGLLEIFPDDRFRGLRCGIRATGSHNPKDDSFGRINFDGAVRNLRRLALPLAKGGNTPLSVSSTICGENQTLTSSKVFRGSERSGATNF